MAEIFCSGRTNRKLGHYHSTLHTKYYYFNYHYLNERCKVKITVVLLPVDQHLHQHETNNNNNNNNNRGRLGEVASSKTIERLIRSQFCNSPSARSIPLPPSQWINKMTSKSPSSSSQNSPNSSGTTSPFNENIMGVRVCPLQLIAAVASS
ncbi:unnamed protein product [Caenorhabditis angaria]|uniref:Uncharacterized protein n=1 Tax=Caenorhabditis angaria TaxID=860376 RepID=A0A9P1MTI7_9PELO|nr:unnamed protein product [Caenorhabditis angaria]